jgi:hypothetical protein
VPDAVLFGDSVPTHLDFVGAYSAKKLRSIIEQYTVHNARYELW